MTLFAHGLYLDEFLWFAIPVGISLWLLRWAERKARQRAENEEVGRDAADVDEERSD